MTLFCGKLSTKYALAVRWPQPFFRKNRNVLRFPGTHMSIFHEV